MLIKTFEKNNEKSLDAIQLMIEKVGTVRHSASIDIQFYGKGVDHMYKNWQ